MNQFRVEETKIIESPFVKEILEIFKQQNEIIKILSAYVVCIPQSSGIDFEDLRK